jgi:hypothetical protein
VETPLGRSLGAYIEVAAIGLVLPRDDVLMLPFRAGLVLR